MEMMLPMCGSPVIAEAQESLMGSIYRARERKQDLAICVMLSRTKIPGQLDCLELHHSLLQCGAGVAGGSWEMLSDELESLVWGPFLWSRETINESYQCFPRLLIQVKRAALTGGWENSLVPLKLLSHLIILFSPVSWAAVFPVFFLCLGIKENMIYWDIGNKNKNTISPSFPLHSSASVCTCSFGACCNLGALGLGLLVSVCSSKDTTHLTSTSLQYLIPVPIVSLRSGADTPLKLEKFLILPCFPFMFSFLAF